MDITTTSSASLQKHENSHGHHTKAAIIRNIETATGMIKKDHFVVPPNFTANKSSRRNKGSGQTYCCPPKADKEYRHFECITCIIAQLTQPHNWHFARRFGPTLVQVSPSPPNKTALSQKEKIGWAACNFETPAWEWLDKRASSSAVVH